MSRPDDIPEDVWDAALTAARDAIAAHEDGFRTSIVALNALVLAIARAILAERERCAKIADEYVWDDHALAQATDLGRAGFITSLLRSPPPSETPPLPL